MAKFRCVCGYQVSTSGSIPNVDQWMFMSDVDLDEFGGMVDIEELYLRLGIMFRCPQSDHLWFFWDGFDHEPTLYEPVKRP